MTTDNDRLSAIRREFQVSPDTFRNIVQGFISEYEQGLGTSSASGLATMIPSFITRLPTGQETGTFLALDLGGTNMRVSAVRLLGKGQVDVIEIRKTISDDLRTGTVNGFFDWIADAVQELVDEIKRSPVISSDTSLVMGVCWSFPLDQSHIASGKILRMGKGFTLNEIEGKDIIQLFQEAFARKALKVVVVALLNDAVGTLVAHAYVNPLTRVGFIYGTGVNAAYPEKMHRIQKLQQTPDDNDAIMLINTELDIFGNSSYLPLTRFDKALDACHSQPGFQAYEKMMSGAYLGELTRRVATELITEHGLFGGHIPLQLQQPWSFSTETMSQLESTEQEAWPDLFASWTFLNTDYKLTMRDMRDFIQVCCIVSSRAAVLAAAAIASIIEQQKLHLSPGDIVIGVNGSTYEKYPGMPERIHTALVDWFGPGIAKWIHLELAKDGGSIGGALVAMLYKDSMDIQPRIESVQASSSRVVVEKDMVSTSFQTVQSHHRVQEDGDLAPSCVDHVIRRYVRPVRLWFKKHIRDFKPSSKTNDKEQT